MVGRQSGPLYDRVEIASLGGTPRHLNAAQFKTMPLAERVRAILGGHVRFFRGDAEVPMKEALED